MIIIKKILMIDFKNWIIKNAKKICNKITKKELIFNKYYKKEILKLDI